MSHLQLLKQKTWHPYYCSFRYNSDPTGINFPIPGNDDARRSINLYCELLKNTIKDAEKFIKGSEEQTDKSTKSINKKK